MRLSEHEQDWEDLAALDPYWAILSESTKQHGGWDLDEFMQQGRDEVVALAERMAELGRPADMNAALDFGCGVGRVTRALAEHFGRAVGVDISTHMIEQARALHADEPSCEFVRNRRDDLSVFGDEQFDLVYSRIVLQHLPSADQILRYVREFVRVTNSEGLLVFHVPTHIPVLRRAQPRRRLYSALRAAGVPPATLYRRLGLQPIRMTFVSPTRLSSTLHDAGARLLLVENDRHAGGVRSATYYCTKGVAAA